MLFNSERSDSRYDEEEWASVCIQTCCGQIGKAKCYRHAMLLLLCEWGESTLNFNTLITSNTRGWIKTSSAPEESADTFLVCVRWYKSSCGLKGDRCKKHNYFCTTLRIFDAVPFISMWKHCAPKWVSEKTASERKALLGKKILHKWKPRGVCSEKGLETKSHIWSSLS